MIYPMFKKLEVFLLLGLLVILSACAQGATLANSQAAISALPDDKARVFIYRKGEFLGSGIQPVVKINGIKTKDCKPKGVFIAELNAGRHNFLVSTEIDSSLDIDLKAGDVKYIECEVGLGLIVWRIYLREQLDPAVGKSLTDGLVYTGTYSE